MPVDVRSVREPRGVVVWEENTERSVDGTLDFEDVCEAKVVEDLELAIEGDLGTGEPLRGESMLNLPRLGVDEGIGAVARVMILMPLLVLVLAGMKRVVCLLAAGTAMRWGWLALHPTVLSCVPVEYSWRASARLCLDHEFTVSIAYLREHIERWICFERADPQTCFMTQDVVLKRKDELRKIRTGVRQCHLG